MHVGDQLRERRLLVRRTAQDELQPAEMHRVADTTTIVHRIRFRPRVVVQRDKLVVVDRARNHAGLRPSLPFQTPVRSQSPERPVPIFYASNPSENQPKPFDAV